MAGANGITAHLLEHLDLALEGAKVDCGAQRAQVVMIADTVEFDVLAIYEQARIRVVFERADPEGSLVGIHERAIVGDSSDGHVTVRGLGAPNPGIGD